MILEVGVAVVVLEAGFRVGTNIVYVVVLLHFDHVIILACFEPGNEVNNRHFVTFVHLMNA